MAKWGSTDFKDLEELEKKLAKDIDVDAIYRRVANQVAALLLNKVKKRTPVGVPPNVDEETYEEYWAGYTGGSLRDKWRVLPVEQQCDSYIVTIENNTSYAPYVEYGHRQEPGRYVPALGKSLKAGWVEGRFMMTISIQEVQALAPRALENAITKALKEVF